MPHTQRWSPLMVDGIGLPAPALFSSALIPLIYRKTNLHWKFTRCKLPPPSSHYWSCLSDLWTCLTGRQRESTAWDSWLKTMSAACAKINKGAVRQINAKNLTPKYRTRWCMGKIPRDWRCSKVPMSQMLHSPTQALVPWKGISCDEQRGLYLLMLSTGHHILSKQYPQVWTPHWDGDIDQSGTSREGTGVEVKL